MADLPPLEPTDFAAYFTAIHGSEPFPWQMRLALRLAGGGAWPAVLDLPTGTGKTAAIDVAVFHLALQAGREDRVAPLRIVYVVDRRTIVDQAYLVARRIRGAIDAASDGVLATVRARLAALSRDGVPLRTALLRGAIARSDLWARSPDQPLVAVSTVDQVGSRLLFRGYGVSDAMKPVHAGLLGNDVLYLLDEVHLSEPFRQTLGAVGSRYGAWSERPIGRPVVTVEMSATPGRTGDSDVLRLEADDERHPVLLRRLSATKRTTLKEVSDRHFVAEIEKTVRALVEQPGATVGVVVNRVRTAREIHQRLSAILEHTEVHLLTGRMRPLDREALERGVIDRIRSGRRRDPEQRPVVVVATQCLEAGADFDFDALVSECASLDALRQRFGRLDRLGVLGGGARGAIVARVGALENDPIYGEALGATWRWLNDVAARDSMTASGAEESGGPTVDFGIRGLQVPQDVDSLGLIAPRQNAPVLLPSHLDAWVQTSPMPTPDPDVALWLHGPERGVADVQIVWRADLTAELLERALSGDDLRGVDEAREVALAIVDAMPPSSGEAMPVPFVAARRWLEGKAAPDVSDVEGSIDVDEEEPEAGKDASPPRATLVWRGDSSQVVRAEGVRPGDTVVVPASYGGIASGTWAPDVRAPVTDVAEIAAFRQRGRAMLRLNRAVVAGLLGGAAPDPPFPGDLDDEETDDPASVQRWMDNIELDRVSSEAATLIGVLRGESASRLRIERIRLGIEDADGESLLISARRRVRFDGNEITTEDDSASFTGVAVPLGQHLGGVRDVASDFAARLGLPSDIAADLRLAARWHDAGKADPRFQRLLHGGNEFKVLTQREPLGKSALPMNDRRARQLAQARSGYPVGARHELMSTALMAAAEGALEPLANDWELVLHLVSSHHGRCRPFAPWVADPGPVDVAWEIDGFAVAASSAHELARLDSGVGERFWRLVRRYGWWGLAWLEAILRLADHRRSEEEQRAGAGGAA